jgi:deoxycytidylate deaminase
MIPKLLRQAAMTAGKCDDIKTFFLAAVAERKDGAVVTSVNHAVFGQKNYDHHAESRVLRKCDYGAILYVARVMKADKKTWANARPCSRCRALIQNLGIKKVFYTIGPNEYGIWAVGGEEKTHKAVEI